jgi:hypothetical protein
MLARYVHCDYQQYFCTLQPLAVYVTVVSVCLAILLLQYQCVSFLILLLSLFISPFFVIHF